MQNEVDETHEALETHSIDGDGKPHINCLPTQHWWQSRNVGAASGGGCKYRRMRDLPQALHTGKKGLN